MLIALWWPPSDEIGAQRMRALATHLPKMGVEVVGLSGTPGSRASAPPEVLVLELDAAGLVGAVKRRLGKSAEIPYSWQIGSRPVGAAGRRARTWLARSLKATMAIPDTHMAWASRVRRAASAKAADATVDAVISSALPLSAHRAASLIAAELGVPWVADYRDLHSGNPYLRHGWVRRRIDGGLEGRWLRSAARVTTVSEECGEVLARILGREVSVIPNGFAREDAAVLEPLDRAGRRRGGTPLRLVYTGTLYEGGRDPTPLLEAIRRWNLDRPSEPVELEMYGPDLGWVRSLAETMGVGGAVRDAGRVPRLAALQAQRCADAGVVVLRDSAYDRGVVTGKLYELAFSGAPVLCVGGPSAGAGRRLIERHRLGVYVPAGEDVLAGMAQLRDGDWGHLPVSGAAAWELSHERVAHDFHGVLRGAIGC